MGDAPTQGRRAGRRAGGGPGGPASDAFAADAKVASGWDTPERAAAPPQPAAEAGGSPEEGPRHGRRKGGAASGWGEPAADAAPASPTQKPPTPEPARRSSPDSDDDGVMQIIPDLEEEIQEEEHRQIAEAAPTQHEMQTIDELDHGALGRGSLSFGVGREDVKAGVLTVTSTADRLTA
eukprot:COSAG01_NODE_16964_length_1189_cov_31.685321_2_plen_179_part_00